MVLIVFIPTSTKGERKAEVKARPCLFSRFKIVVESIIPTAISEAVIIGCIGAEFLFFECERVWEKQSWWRNWWWAGSAESNWSCKYMFLASWWRPLHKIAAFCGWLLAPPRCNGHSPKSFARARQHLSDSCLPTLSPWERDISWEPL